MYDADLGYIPKPNMKRKVRVWSNAVVTHEAYGVRKTYTKGKGSISFLTVGDSYAYGVGVSDDQTWQSCLSKNFPSFKFVNAGVPGYGTAQSILRAQSLKHNILHNYLVVQILVGEDLARDQLKSKWGLLRPYLTKDAKDEAVKQNQPLDKFTSGTKYGNTNATLMDYIILNITLMHHVPQLREIRYQGIGRIRNSATIESDNPATIRQILSWSVEKANTLSDNVIWLLQYQPNLRMQEIQDERRMIIDLLKDRDQKVVDTYYALNRPGMSTTNGDLWQHGHHTEKGNLIVCNEMSEMLKNSLGILPRL